MSRSAMLSAGGDVFLADFCLSLWKRFWYDEVDAFYVAYNNHAEVPRKTAYEFLRKWEQEPKVHIIYTPTGVGNGTPITQMLLASKEDSLLLLEDDSFIFTPGIVSNWFSYLEDPILKVDIVGSPRYTAGEIAEAARVKYNLDYSGVGDHGFGWWPSFFVCRREDLLKTDLDFGSKAYPDTVYFKEIDHTMLSTEFTDTFTWASLQLRYMGLHTYEIPQNHCYPEDFVGNRKMYLFDDPKYIHGGSLSSGYGGYLNKKLPPVDTDMQKKDIETRVAWWKIVSDATEGYEDFKIIYKNYIVNLIDNVKLSRDRIQDKYNGYRSIIRI